MKYKTTAKEIRMWGNNVKSAGYCSLQYLLKFHEPIAYTVGVYGWNFDIYEVYGVTICTGVRGMVGERAKGVSEYEGKAMKVCSVENSMSLQEKKKKIEKLLKEFCLKNGGYVY